MRPSQAAVAGRTRCCSCRLACWPKAIDAGATVTMEIADQFWGDRFGSVKDPFGHSWSIATHVEDLTPEEIADTSLVPSPQQPSSSLNAGKATRARHAGNGVKIPALGTRDELRQAEGLDLRQRKPRLGQQLLWR